MPTCRPVLAAHLVPIGQPAVLAHGVKTPSPKGPPVRRQSSTTCSRKACSLGREARKRAFSASASWARIRKGARQLGRPRRPRGVCKLASPAGIALNAQLSGHPSAVRPPWQ